ncbi:MAG TPA: multiheme c-type cytochrome [Candidatus Polarisedimenticolia bacterium]|jgi:hypothetical protein
MKHSRWLLDAGAVALLFAGTAAMTIAAEPSAHAFVGADKCKLCHNSPAKGAQYTKWSESRHAQAFATLATAEARKIAAAKGIADPQKADQCLRCHVTGHGQPADKLADKYNAAQGVSCESCHGAGADYWKMEVMKDRARSVSAGMVLPKEENCKICHNADSPTFKGFDFAAAVQKIAHPNPQKAAR